MNDYPYCATGAYIYRFATRNRPACTCCEGRHIARMPERTRQQALLDNPELREIADNEGRADAVRGVHLSANGRDMAGVRAL